MKKYLLIIAVLLVSAPAVFACTCGGISPTVNLKYDTSEFVGVVKFISAKEGEMKDGELEILGLYAEVQKVYKGPLKPGDKLYFANKIITSCNVYLGKETIGKEMLLFEDIPKEGINGDWGLWVCGGHKFVERAADELLYLNNFEKAKGRSRISGLLSYSEKQVVEERPAVYQGLAGYKVKITGNGKTHELTTDENGVYEIYDLAQGVYQIEVPENPQFILGKSRKGIDFRMPEEFEKAFRALPKEVQDKIELNSKDGIGTVMILPGRQASASFDYRPRSSVSGTVTGPDGKPLDSVYLDLVSVEGTPSIYFIYIITDKNGNYTADEIPPGKYYLVANEHGRASPREPYDMTFYPGTTNKTKAVPIQIVLGDDIKNINFRIPKLYETVTVSGKFVFADGKLVNGGSLEFVLDGEPKQAARRVYEYVGNGEFSMQLLKGFPGKLTPSLQIAPQDYANCPEIKSNEPAPRRDRFPQYILPPIPVAADKNVTGLVIKLPFKSCPKGK